MPYTERQLKEIRKDLDAELRRLREEILRIEKRSAKADEKGLVSELADYDDNHPADIATETFEREKALALGGNVSELMTKVERALEKLDEGTYGQCDRCGGEIASQRMRVLSYATMCVKCQGAIEGR